MTMHDSWIDKDEFDELVGAFSKKRPVRDRGSKRSGSSTGGSTPEDNEEKKETVDQSPVETQKNQRSAKVKKKKPKKKARKSKEEKISKEIKVKKKKRKRSKKTERPPETLTEVVTGLLSEAQIEEQIALEPAKGEALDDLPFLRQGVSEKEEPVAKAEPAAEEEPEKEPVAEEEPEEEPVAEEEPEEEPVAEEEPEEEPVAEEEPEEEPVAEEESEEEPVAEEEPEEEPVAEEEPEEEPVAEEESEEESVAEEESEEEPVAEEKTEEEPVAEEEPEAEPVAEEESGEGPEEESVSEEEPVAEEELAAEEESTVAEEDDFSSLFFRGASDLTKSRRGTGSEPESDKAVIALAQARKMAEKNHLIKGIEPKQSADNEGLLEIFGMTGNVIRQVSVDAGLPPTLEFTASENLPGRLATFAEKAEEWESVRQVQIFDREGYLLHGATGEANNSSMITGAVLARASEVFCRRSIPGTVSATQVTVGGGEWRCLIAGRGDASRILAEFQVDRPLETREIEAWSKALADAVIPANDLP